MGGSIAPKVMAAAPAAPILRKSRRDRVLVMDFSCTYIHEG
jgi:hypothetical protein